MSISLHRFEMFSTIILKIIFLLLSFLFSFSDFHKVHIVLFDVSHNSLRFSLLFLIFFIFNWIISNDLPWCFLILLLHQVCWTPYSSEFSSIILFFCSMILVWFSLFNFSVIHVLISWFFIDLYLFRIGYWRFILFYWLCFPDLCFGSFSLISAHLKKWPPLLIFMD